MRTVAAFILLMVIGAPSARADDPTNTDPIAPTAAVAAAWRAQAPKPSATLRALVVSYGALHGLDMASTIVARQRGADPPPHSSVNRILLPSLLKVAECQNDMLGSAAASMRTGCAASRC